MRHIKHLPTAYINLENIVYNYQSFLRLSAIASPGAPKAQALLHPGYGQNKARTFNWPEQMAVVKAEAYGHGLLEVSSALFQAGASLFAVGSVQEGCELSKGLAGIAGGREYAVISLLGFVTADDIALCKEYGIIPLLHSFAQLDLINGLETQGEPLSVAIKFNSGMSRLGFNEAEIEELARQLKASPAVKPVLAVSHLHSAGHKDGWDKNRDQAERFKRMFDPLRAEWPDMAASLANTAGTCYAKELAEIIGPHICRIGLGLYGLSPMEGDATAKACPALRPAMSVSTPILTRREVPAGQGISYGHMFVTQKPTAIALAAIGYADGLPLALSNRGAMNISGMRANILGKVCMQITALNINELSTKGDELPDKAWIMGGPYPNAITAEEIAELCGIHVYNIVCMLGCNERVYTPAPVLP